MSDLKIAGSRFKTLALVAGGFERPRHPAGTKKDGKNVGGQFMETDGGGGGGSGDAPGGDDGNSEKPLRSYRKAQFPVPKPLSDKKIDLASPMSIEELDRAMLASDLDSLNQTFKGSDSLFSDYLGGISRVVADLVVVAFDEASAAIDGLSEDIENEKFGQWPKTAWNKGKKILEEVGKALDIYDKTASRVARDLIDAIDEAGETYFPEPPPEPKVYSGGVKGDIEKTVDAVSGGYKKAKDSAKKALAELKNSFLKIIGQYEPEDPPTPKDKLKQSTRKHKSEIGMVFAVGGVVALSVLGAATGIAELFAGAELVHGTITLIDKAHKQRAREERQRVSDVNESLKDAAKEDVKEWEKANKEYEKLAKNREDMVTRFGGDIDKLMAASADSVVTNSAKKQLVFRSLIQRNIKRLDPEKEKGYKEKLESALQQMDELQADIAEENRLLFEERENLLASVTPDSDPAEFLANLEKHQKSIAARNERADKRMAEIRSTIFKIPVVDG